jgi:hypothetical protein
MTPVYIYRHKVNKKIHCACLHDALHFERSEQWDLVESVDPLSWITKHYPNESDRETAGMAKLAIPYGFKLIKVPFGWQVCSIQEES